MVDDDILNDIEKLTAADDSDTTSTRRSEEMSIKKSTSCEQKLEHTKTESDTSSNNDNIDQDIVQENNTDSNFSLEASDMEICANCGKEDAKNICNKCKSVKYCNASCKKKHRSKHKKDCEEHVRRAAKLHDEEMTRAAELHDIELFKQPPQQDDCPICFLLLPTLGSGKRYQSCCGRDICSGCIHAMDKICPFCRTPTPETDDEVIKRARKRLDVGDAEAIFIVGYYHSKGICGLPQDMKKALELWHRAAELGCTKSLVNIGNALLDGRGVEVDTKKAVYYWELAAMKGNAAARYNFGNLEGRKGNVRRALRHFMIAVEGGHINSLKAIHTYYSKGRVTKDDYTKALRAYQDYLNEVKSSQRDEAAAAYEGYKYFE